MSDYIEYRGFLICYNRETDNWYAFEYQNKWYLKKSQKGVYVPFQMVNEVSVFRTQEEAKANIDQYHINKEWMIKEKEFIKQEEMAI